MFYILIVDSRIIEEDFITVLQKLASKFNKFTFSLVEVLVCGYFLRFHEVSFVNLTVFFLVRFPVNFLTGLLSIGFKMITFIHISGLQFLQLEELMRKGVFVNKQRG